MIIKINIRQAVPLRPVQRIFLQKSPKRMQQHAEEACAAVSIQSYARVDFMLDTVTMEDYALEVNTLPGMTPTSLMPQEAQALGLSFDDLCEWILAVSLKKYK